MSNLSIHIPILIAFLGVVGQGCSSITAKPARIDVPAHNFAVTTGQLKFGYAQVDKMMQDRMEMATCVTKGDVIYEWVARQFAGGAIGQPIYWHTDVSNIYLHSLSLNQPPGVSNSAYIAVREIYARGSKKGRKLSCEQLWSCAIFELYNIASDREIIANDRAAISGKVSREQWLLNITKIEFVAVNKTAAFYRATWEPRARNKNLSTDGSIWFADQPATYEEWMKQFKDPDGYPYYLYKDYDQHIAPYVKK